MLTEKQYKATIADLRLQFLSKTETYSSPLWARRFEVLSIIAIPNGAKATLRDQLTGSICTATVFSLAPAGNWSDHNAFLRQAHAVAALGCDSAPLFLDLLDDDAGTVALIIENVDSIPASKYVASGLSITAAHPSFIGLLPGFLDGVHSLHRAGMVHRGICPTAMALRSHGTDGIRLMLTDFSSVGVVSEGTPLSQSEGSTAIGSSPHYSAPEVFGPPRVTSDIYSLGLSIAALVSGRSPATFRRTGLGHDIRALAALPSWLAELLQEMVHPDPGQRLQSLDPAVTRAIEHVLQSHSDDQASTPLPRDSLASAVENQPKPPGVLESLAKLFTPPKKRDAPTKDAQGIGAALSHAHTVRPKNGVEMRETGSVRGIACPGCKRLLREPLAPQPGSIGWCGHCGTCLRIEAPSLPPSER